MCDLSKMQTALQEMPLRKMHLNRNGPEMGVEQRRKANPIQKLFQEERRTGTTTTFGKRREGNDFEEKEISRSTSLSEKN